VHSDNSTLRDVTNFLTHRIDILEDRLLNVSNLTGPHIARSSHRRSLNSVGYCTHYFGLIERRLLGGGCHIVVHGISYKDPQEIIQGTILTPAVAQWLRCCTSNRNVAGSIPTGVSGFFIDIKSFRSHCGPGVDSASNRNEYQEYFLG